jgi:hypothetical protein
MTSQQISPCVDANTITYRDTTSSNNSARCLVGWDLHIGRGSWVG